MSSRNLWSFSVQQQQQNFVSSCSGLTRLSSVNISSMTNPSSKYFAPCSPRSSSTYRTRLSTCHVMMKRFSSSSPTFLFPSFSLSKKWTDERTPKFVIQIEVTARRERRPVFERTAAAAAHDYVRLWQAVLPCALHRERERERKRKRERHLFRHLIARLVVHHTLHCSKIRSLPLFACPPKTKER